MKPADLDSLISIIARIYLGRIVISVISGNDRHLMTARDEIKSQIGQVLAGRDDVGIERLIEKEYFQESTYNLPFGKHRFQDFLDLAAVFIFKVPVNRGMETVHEFNFGFPPEKFLRQCVIRHAV